MTSSPLIFFFFCLLAIPVRSRQLTVSVVSRPLEFELPSLSIYILQSRYFTTKVCLDSICEYFSPCSQDWRPPLPHLFVEEIPPIECDFPLKDEYPWIELRDLFALYPKKGAFADFLCPNFPQPTLNTTFSKKAIQPQRTFFFQQFDLIWYFDQRCFRGHLLIDLKDFLFLKHLPFSFQQDQDHDTLEISPQDQSLFCFISGYFSKQFDEHWAYAALSYLVWPHFEMGNSFPSYYNIEKLALEAFDKGSWETLDSSTTTFFNSFFILLFTIISQPITVIQIFSPLFFVFLLLFMKVRLPLQIISLVGYILALFKIFFEDSSTIPKSAVLLLEFESLWGSTTWKFLNPRILSPLVATSSLIILLFRWPIPKLFSCTKNLKVQKPVHISARRDSPQKKIFWNSTRLFKK